MVFVHVVTASGESRTIDADPALSLMEALRRAGCDDITAICGGEPACGTCHVYLPGLDQTSLPALSDDEDAVLDMSDYRTRSSRLSCQIPVSILPAGTRITIAPAD
jgi:2Fe-2S ferredoxin